MITLVTLLSFVVIAQPQEGVVAKLDTYFTRHMPFGYGGTVLIVKEGKVVLNKSYGMADDNPPRPNSSDTVYSLGSVVKQFTAAAILKLEEMGKLKVEDPIGKYLEGVPEDKSAITLHHLLRHNSGLPGAVGDDYDSVTREEMIQKAFARPLAFKPGERYLYSNVGFSLLAAVVEKASGKSYEQFVYDHLFRPAGMTHTGYRIPAWRAEKLAASFRDGQRTPPNPQLNFPTWYVMGNGEMLSTAGDMYRWVQKLAGDDILSKESKAKMWTPGLDNYGYGWVIEKTPYGRVITHNGGSTTGAGCFLAYQPDSRTFVMVFANRNTQLMWDGNWEGHVGDLVFGGDAPVPPAMSGNPVSGEGFAGVYGSSKNGQLTFSFANGKFRVLADDAASARSLFGKRYVEDPRKAANAYEVMNALYAGDNLKAKEAMQANVDPAVVGQQLRTAMADLEKLHGKLQEMQIRYCLWSSAERQDYEAVMRLEFDKRVGYISTFWRDGKYMGRNRTLRDVPANLWVAATDADQVAVFDPVGGESATFAYHPESRRLELESDRAAVWVKQLDPTVLVGKTAAELAVSNWVNTTGLTLESLRGKVVVLDFWTYWCQPCLACVPELNKLYEDYKDKGVVVIGIHCDDVAKRDAVIAEKQIKYPVCQDREGLTRKAYMINAYPGVFVIDRKGVIRVVDPSNFERAVKMVLEQQS